MLFACPQDTGTALKFLTDSKKTLSNGSYRAHDGKSTLGFGETTSTVTAVYFLPNEKNTAYGMQLIFSFEIWHNNARHHMPETPTSTPSCSCMPPRTPKKRAAAFVAVTHPPMYIGGSRFSLNKQDREHRNYHLFTNRTSLRGPSSSLHRLTVPVNPNVNQCGSRCVLIRTTDNKPVSINTSQSVKRTVVN